MARKSKEIEPNVNNMSLITFLTSLHSLFEDSSLRYCYIHCGWKWFQKQQNFNQIFATFQSGMRLKKTLQNFEKSSKMPKIWQKMKKNPFPEIQMSRHKNRMKNKKVSWIAHLMGVLSVKVLLRDSRWIRPKQVSIFGTCFCHSAILPRKRSLSFLKFSFVHQSCIITKAASWRLAASARARSIRLGSGQSCHCS